MRNLKLILILTSCFFIEVQGQNMGNNMIHGFVKQGFEPVYEEFTKNFENGKELGSALCVYYQGEKVIDLWGGFSDKKKKHEFKKNTMVLFFSATKGVASLCIAKLYSEGKIDYYKKVSAYWPEFAKNGKENITVSQLLSHQSGLCLWNGKLAIEQIADSNLLAEKLENTTPMWTPGHYSGYSAGLAGFYMSELVRRVDDKHRTLGQYFQEEFATPIGLEFYIGLPDTVSDTSVSYIKLINPFKRIMTLGKLPKALRKTVSRPNSLFMKSITLTKGYNVNERATWRIEEPSGNGIGTARSVAYLYSLLVNNSGEIGISKEAINELSNSAFIPKYGGTDKVMGIPLYYRNGFMKNGEGSSVYNNKSCFGFGGASGSMAFADPINKIGYCYVPNKMGYDFPDGREKNIQKVLYECVERLKE
ncbi:MAG: serine hydrolase [Bacteroidales bacterium]|nr:serine hydrolase [Bacteroidales bacterium]